jgi:hypothetical protein
VNTSPIQAKAPPLLIRGLVDPAPQLRGLRRVTPPADTAYGCVEWFLYDRGPRPDPDSPPAPALGR